MRKRLFGVIVVMFVLLAALPLTASAATRTATIQVTATSYTDLAGTESDSLCAPISITPSVIETTISVDQQSNFVGSGSGSGTMSITLFGNMAILDGAAEINGQPAPISGFPLSLTCLLPGYAIASFSTVSEVELLNGDVMMAAFSIFGTISDGVHPNQGRVSLTISVREVSGDVD